jgi:uncharacterized protein YjbI with pentapeptide repeats
VSSETRKTILAALKPGADLDLRGMPIDVELLHQLLAAVRPEDGPPTLGEAWFHRTQFSGDADFSGAQFSGDADFSEAQFSGITRFGGAQFSRDVEFNRAQFSRDAWFGGAQFGYAEFDGAQFSGDAEFRGAQFSGDSQFGGAQFSGITWFSETQFSGDAEFNRAQFSRDARFGGAQFSGITWFSETQFSGDAEFNRAQFSGYTEFSGAQFSGVAWFPDAQFSGHVEFNRAQFNGDAWFLSVQFSGVTGFSGAQFRGATRFDEVQFKQAGTFGPVLAVSILAFDRATFEEGITIETVGAELSCVGTRFAQAATLRLRRTQVVLDRAVFAKPSTIAFAPDPFKHYDPDAGREVETFGEGPVARVEGGRESRPRLLSLRGVDVATLTLSDLDLGACLFQGAHHLDALRIEGARPFADTPAAWRLQLGRWRVPVWRRWSRRQTLAEEHHWRSEPSSPPMPGRGLRLTRPAWHGLACQTPKWVAMRSGQQVQRLTPDRLVVLYRSLRKAQEDSKNEPGAADFYYGEMEMRRQDRETPWAERVIVWLYWLVSGYGLRGLRALASLAVVVVGLAALLHIVGYAMRPSPASVWGSLLYAASSTLSIGDDQVRLTGWGKLLRITLRLTGPVLLGLALLSIRNRVKR